MVNHNHNHNHKAYFDHTTTLSNADCWSKDDEANKVEFVVKITDDDARRRLAELFGDVEEAQQSRYKSADWKINVKAPAPRDVFCEGTTNKRAPDQTQLTNSHYDTNEGWSFLHGYASCDDCKGSVLKSACAHACHCSPDDEHVGRC